MSGYDAVDASHRQHRNVPKLLLSSTTANYDSQET
jgi:hypothetical protein